MTLTKSLRTAAAALLLAGLSAGASFAQDKVTLPGENKVTSAEEVPADAIVVEIDKLKYQTPELTVKAGDTVTWVNKEVMPHNVAFKAGTAEEGELKGAMMTKGQAFSVTFNEAGTYDYHCTPHPFMRGKVIVE